MDTSAKRKLMKFFEILTGIVGILLIAAGIFHIIFDPIIGLFIFILVGLIMLMASTILKIWRRNLTEVN